MKKKCSTKTMINNHFVRMLSNSITPGTKKATALHVVCLLSHMNYKTSVKYFKVSYVRLVVHKTKGKRKFQNQCTHINIVKKYCVYKTHTHTESVE